MPISFSLQDSSSLISVCLHVIIYNLTILVNAESKTDANIIRITKLKNALELRTTATCVARTALQKPRRILNREL